jgi:hypothetical protein
MKNKKSIAGIILAVSFVFSLILFSCGGDTGGDEWFSVTNLSQLDGTWKGSYSESMTLKDLISRGAFDDLGDYEALIKDMDVTINLNADITMTIDADQETQSSTIKYTLAFSGKDVDVIWAFVLIMGAESGFEINNSKKTLSFTETSENNPIDENDFLDVLEVNKDGTKIRVPADSELGNSKPFVLNKQK